MLLFPIIISIFVLTSAEDTEFSLDADYSDSNSDVSEVKTDDSPSSVIGSNANANGGKVRYRGANHFGTPNTNGNNYWRGNGGFTRGSNGGFSNANSGGFGSSNGGNTRGFNGGNGGFANGNRGHGTGNGGLGGNSGISAGNGGPTDNISTGTSGVNTRSNGNSASTESRISGGSIDRLGFAEALGRGFGAGLGSAGGIDTNRIASASNLASLNNNLQSRSTSGRSSNNFY